MVFHLDCRTTFQILSSWEKLRRIPDYEFLAGRFLFQRLFVKCPATKLLFGFPLNIDPYSNSLVKSKRFIMHGAYIIQMLGKAVNLLGPDEELLTEILEDLGKKHAMYGVKEEHFKFMGESLHETLEQLLKDDYTPEEAEAWHDVYNYLSSEMCQSMSREQVVINSWKTLTRIDNYKEVAGSLLFRRFFEICPPAKTYFGFPIDMDPTSESMLNSRRFKMHAECFMGMLGSALHMIEKDELEENMENLGKIHSAYEVDAKYFPLMEEALMYSLRKTLKSDFDSKVENAWLEVYDNLSRRIINAMNSEKSRADF